MHATAAVFDMDGTLVDNMLVHAEAWVEFCARRGLDVPSSRFAVDWAGRKNDEVLHALLGPDLDRATLDAMALEKEERYRALYRPRLAPMPGLLAFLARLTAADIALAVATAAPPANRELVLDGLDLRRGFRAVIGAEHAARGKPFPDIYLAAARELAHDPARCVAFEDAINGVRSARAAGMRVVGVVTTTPAADLEAAGCDWILHDFARPPAGLLSAFGMTALAG